MRTPKLFLGIFALALILPLMLLACGGSDEPTDGPASERSTATVAPEPPAATPSPAASGSAETDREALVALYNATEGEDWIFSNNWLSDAPLGEWKGVTTNDDGRVIGLSLINIRLIEEIPAELGNLSNLTDLNLSGNRLTGKIPPELGSLSNLRKLELHENELGGEIPAELGSLSNLAGLLLQDNVAPRQRLERGDTAGVGQPDQPVVPDTQWKPVERGDTAGVGQPDQPVVPDTQWKPVERGDTAGVGQPLQPKRSVPPRQRLDREDTAGAGQSLQADRAGPQLQRLERVRAKQFAGPVEYGTFRPG